MEQEQIQQFSSLIFGDGAPATILLDSCVYYLLRRLVHFGGYKLQQLRNDEQPDTDLKPSIEEYVGRTLRLKITP